MRVRSLEGNHVKWSAGSVCCGSRDTAGSAGRLGAYLPALGVYGFGGSEPVILAALVTEDPLLLIGASGTAYLLTRCRRHLTSNTDTTMRA